MVRALGQKVEEVITEISGTKLKTLIINLSLILYL